MDDYRPQIRQRTTHFNHDAGYIFDADAYFKSHPRSPDDADYIQYPLHRNTSTASTISHVLLWMLAIVAVNLLFRYFLAFVAQFQHLWRGRATPFEPDDYWPFSSQPREVAWGTESNWDEPEEEEGDDEDDEYWGY
jgi:hypothetical protein